MARQWRASLPLGGLLAHISSDLRDELKDVLFLLLVPLLLLSSSSSSSSAAAVTAATEVPQAEFFDPTRRLPADVMDSAH